MTSPSQTRANSFSSSGTWAARFYGALLRLGLAQQFLDLLPRQVGLPQDAAEGVAAGEQAERLEDPLLELLHGPVVARQALRGGARVLHRLNDLFYLLLSTRGERPPGWRYA